MPLRSPDPRFPSLTLHCLGFYWIVCLVTLGLTTGSVVKQVGVYRSHCETYESAAYTSYDDINYGTQCLPGDILVFALGLGVATIAMIQSSVQLFKFYRHHISPARLAILNAVVMVLWIVVIAIGWNPTYYTYDSFTGISTPNVTGWLYAYSAYWYNDSYYGGIGVTLALAMGFAVMSIVSFGLATLLALYAFIVHHRNSRRQRLADNEALVTAPKLSEKTGDEPNQTHSTSERSVNGVSGADQARSNMFVTGVSQDRLTRSRSM